MVGRVSGSASAERAKSTRAQHFDLEVAMANELSGQKIAFLVAPEGVEQVELTEPWEAVKTAG